ncbi:hypothetical protein PG984_003118 [Apiospora sp. TS-2023a]
MVQLFQPFAKFNFLRQAEAKTITQAPPFSLTTIGSVHIFTSSLFKELAKSSDIYSHARFYLILAAEEIRRYGELFPFIHKVLHQLLSKARSDGTQLPPDLNDIFDNRDARLLGHARLELFPQDYSIAFRMGISGQDSEAAWQTRGLLVVWLLGIPQKTLRSTSHNGPAYRRASMVFPNLHSNGAPHWRHSELDEHDGGLVLFPGGPVALTLGFSLLFGAMEYGSPVNHGLASAVSVG